VKNYSDSSKKLPETDIIQMFDLTTFRFTIYFLCLVGMFFQQTVSIPMDTNCAPLFSYLFLHSYEANFIQGGFSVNAERS